MIDLSNCKSLSDISFLLYGSKNYSSLVDEIKQI